MIIMYLYFSIGIYITTVLSHSDSCLYWCLAYIHEGISDMRIYVTVTSPYPRDLGVTISHHLAMMKYQLLLWIISWEERIRSPPVVHQQRILRGSDTMIILRRRNFSILFIKGYINIYRSRKWNKKSTNIYIQCIACLYTCLDITCLLTPDSSSWWIKYREFENTLVDHLSSTAGMAKSSLVDCLSSMARMVKSSLVDHLSLMAGMVKSSLVDCLLSSVGMVKALLERSRRRKPSRWRVRPKVAVEAKIEGGVVVRCRQGWQ